MKFLPLACALTLTVLAVPLQADSVESNWIMPRTEHGHPDLQGLWHNTTQTPIERPVALGEQRAYTEDEVRVLEEEARDFERRKAQPLEGNRLPPPVGGAIGQEADINFSDVFINVLRVKGEYRTSMIVDPPDGRFPFREDGRSQDIYGQYRSRGLDPSDGPEGRTAGDRCLSRGIPPMTVTPYNNNFQIVQTGDYVVIVAEMVHDARIIRLNAAHYPRDHKTWMGDAVGHWEGDTLVVHTKNFRPEISHFRLVSSDQLELTERFELVGDDEIFYSVTVTDPLIYTRPFTEELTLMRRGAGERMYEYSCHEGNYGLEGILAGARRAEWDAR